MNNLKINHVAILVCVVLMHVLGFLWYGPLFGEKWMAYLKLDMAQIQANAPGAGIWVLNLIASVAPLYMLAWLFTKLDITTGIRGAGIAFLLTFSMHHLIEMNSNMFAQQPYGLAWVTGGYSLVSFTLSGFILGAWTKRQAK
jgi:Protein of unknown function (DUF1761)